LRRRDCGDAARYSEDRGERTHRVVAWPQIDTEFRQLRAFHAARSEARHVERDLPGEAVQILLEKSVSAQVFAILKEMKPIRQIDAAEHMVAGGTYTVPFA
jgi:hypothetical protein